MSNREILGGSDAPSSRFGTESTTSGTESTARTFESTFGQTGQGQMGEGQPGAGQTGQQGQGSGSTMDQAKEQATQALDTAKEKAGQVAEQASAKADAGLDKAATGLDKAADMLRERTQGMDGQGGGVQSVATKAADRLDMAAQYLKDKDSQQLMTDLEDLVRRKPTQTLLVAAGVGFLLSKVVR